MKRIVNLVFMVTLLATQAVFANNSIVPSANAQTLADKPEMVAFQDIESTAVEASEMTTTGALSIKIMSGGHIVCFSWGDACK